MAHWRPRVVTAAGARRTLAPGQPSPPEQSYIAKVVTYIPAEIIATYQAAIGVIPVDAQQALWWTGLILLIIAPVWTAVAAKDTREPIPWYQALAALIAFAIWLLAMKSPLFDFAGGMPGYVRSLILIGAGLLFPLMEKILQRLGIPV